MPHRLTLPTVFALLALVLPLTACGGAIPAPPEIIELSQNATAFQERFDEDQGTYRLVLVLSPA